LEERRQPDNQSLRILTSRNGGVYKSAMIPVNGVEESFLQIKVYPNPASEMVHIEGVEADEVMVYNALGQMVKTVQGSNAINVSGLAEGVYLLRITDAEGRSHTARVVKE